MTSEGDGGAGRGPGRRAVLGGLAAAALVPPAPAAEAWPTRPIRMLVGYAPGGGADITARVLGARMSESLGQQIVVENRAGASGIIAEEAVAKSPPDGYTLAMVATTHVSNPSLYRKLPYDTVKDFTPLSLLLKVPNVLAVHPSLPVHTVAELIALAKSKPGDLNYANTGGGSAQFLAAELFKSMTGTDIVGIPYRGGGPALIDVVAGQLPIIFGNVASTLPHIRGGALRALATTGAQRASVLPDLPTMAECGLAGYAVYEWNGVLGPARLEPALVTRLHDELVRALAAPDVRERLSTLGAELVGSTPAEFAKFIDDEIPKWAKVVNESGIHIE